MNFRGVLVLLSLVFVNIQSQASSTLGIPSKLAFTTQPSNATAGSIISPTVKVAVEDASGKIETSFNGLVSMSSSKSKLLGTTNVYAVKGIATFSNLSLDKAASDYSLNASSFGLKSATSNSFTVSGGDVASLGMTTKSQSITAGACSGISTVQFYDAYGNPTVIPVQTSLNLYSSKVGAILSFYSDNKCTQEVDAITVLKNTGSASFYFASDVSGSATLTVEELSFPLNPTNQNETIQVGKASQLAFTVEPSNVVAGANISPAVKVAVEDQYNNIVTTANVSIGLSATFSQLLGTTQVSTVQGIATFSNIYLAVTGTDSLIASAPDFPSSKSNQFNVTAGSPTTLSITSQAQSIPAGTCSAFVNTQAYDKYGNSAVFTNGASLGLSTQGAPLTFYSDSTCTQSISSLTILPGQGSGILYFSGTLMGNSTLTVSGQGLLPANQAEGILFGKAFQLSFIAQPSNVIAGNIITPAVQVAVEDAYGNLVGNSNIQVSLSLYNTSIQLQGSTTMNAQNGIATFSNIFVNVAANGLKLMAVSAGLTGCLSNSFNVTPGAPSSLTIYTQPQVLVAGSCSSSVAFQAYDQYGNQATFSQQTLLGLSSSGSTSLSFYSDSSCTKNISQINMAQGAGNGSFYFSGTAVGSGTLNVTGSNLTPGQQNETINVGPATQLAFTSQPTQINAGQFFTPAMSVQVQDNFGNPVTNSIAPITMAIGVNPSGASTLNGTNPVTAVSGTAVFSNLTVTFGGQGLTLVASSAGLKSTTSDPFLVLGPNAVISATVPPMSISDPGYADFMQYIVPHIQAIAPLVKWSDLDKGYNNGTAIVPCEETTCPHMFDSLDEELVPFVKAGLNINLLIAPITDSNNGPNVETPKYVFDPKYAAYLTDTLGHGTINPQDQVVCSHFPGDGFPINPATGQSAVWNNKNCQTYGKGVSPCPSPGQDGYSDTTGFPVVYEVPFMTAYQTFMAQVIQHYSSQSKSGTQGAYIGAHMNYLRFGMASGAENDPLCIENWPGTAGLDVAPPPNQYTSALYLAGGSQPGYMKSMLAWEQLESQNSQNTTRMITVNTHTVSQDISYADIEAGLAVQYGIGFGMEALDIGDPYNDANNLPCGDDWCANFDRYHNQNMLYLQTVIPVTQPIYNLGSVTTNGDGTATATPSVNNVSIADFYLNIPFLISGNSNSSLNGLFTTLSTQQNSDPNINFSFTGTQSGAGGTLMSPDYLPVNLPFAVQHHAKAFELFSCDLFYAFDTNPNGLPKGVKCNYNSPGMQLNGANSPQYYSTISTISGKP